MRRLQRHDRGLAEIVGTLMLVLIVVVAVTAFSVFITQYEQQVLAQQTYQHDKALESIHVTSLAPVYVNGTYESLNFTLVSDDINPTTITGISVNDAPVYFYNATTLVYNATPTLPIETHAENLVISPESSALVTVHFPFPVYNTSVPSSFWPDLGPAHSLNDYVKISVFTTYSNEFTQVFIPPDAVISVDVGVTGSNSVTTTLDGTHSFQQGQNTTIVSWDWTVTNLTNTSHSSSSYGGIVAQASPLTSPNSYLISLEVTNTDGLEGFANLTYTPD